MMSSIIPQTSSISRQQTDVESLISFQGSLAEVCGSGAAPGLWLWTVWYAQLRAAGPQLSIPTAPPGKNVPVRVWDEF